MASKEQLVIEIFLSSACRSLMRAHSEACRMEAYGLQDDLEAIHEELGRLLEDALLNRKRLYVSRI